MVVPTSSHAQYAISPFAGGGPNGFAAPSSSIGYPGSVARDSLGNTYIADSYSNRILKIDTAGTLTVFAGNDTNIGGAGGYLGDGGPASVAELARPQGVAVDVNGNVFIADSGNSVIRCVVGSAGGCFGSTLPVGTISTVAGLPYPGSACQYGGDGGPATGAFLCQPGAVFVDAVGDLFIADTQNSAIREVLANGTIKTVAGTGTPCGTVAPCGDGGLATSAQLDFPGGVFVDGTGNIFVADTYDAVVREVVAATGNIQTVAGTYYAYLGADDVCQYAGDGGLATSAYLCQPGGVSVDGAGNIFIADSYNHVIREVTVSSGNISTIAGIGKTGGYTGDGGPATSAELDYPNSVLVDASGNVYIADTNNFAIRAVSGGTIQTFAGNHTLGYSGDGSAPTAASLNVPGATFVDAAGNVFIADVYNCVIREVAGATGMIETVAGKGTCGYSGDGAASKNAELNYPNAVFVDALGDIFIADTGNSVVREVVASTGFIQTVAGNGTSGYGGDGGAATSAQLQFPGGAFVDAGGNIFIADTTNHVIRCVVGSVGGCFGSTLAAGSITTLAGTPATPCASPATACGDGGAATSAQLNFPSGVFGDENGNLYIADTFDSKIREVVAATGDIQTVAGTGATGYSGDGGPATSAQLFDPAGLFIDNLGNIFVADTFNSVVREIVAVSGNIQTAAGNGTQGYLGDGGAGSSAQLDHPWGVAAGPSGTIFVADTENSRVRKLTSTVNVTAVPTSATLPTGGSQQFAATVSGANDTSVTWQVNNVTGGNATTGTIDSLGAYIAPAAAPSSAITVRAVANANGVASTSVPVTIVSSSSLTVTISTSPTVTEVYTGATQTFVANVTGTANTAVNWTVNQVAGGNAAVGTISGGVYTAPATVPSPALVVIGAQSQADTTVSASYPVTIVTAPAASQPAPQTISSGGTAQYSISLNASTGSPTQPITLSCLQSSLPTGATCTFTPSKITPGPSAVPFSLSIGVPAARASLDQGKIPTGGSQEGKSDFAKYCAAFLPLCAFVLMGSGKRPQRRMPLVTLLCGVALLAGCGGGSGSSGTGGQNPKTYSVQVQGSTAAQPNPITLTTVTLNVQ